MKLRSQVSPSANLTSQAYEKNFGNLISAIT